jgi:hypothetical protein
MNKRLLLVKRASQNLFENEDLETLVAYMLIETETDDRLQGEALTVDVNRKAMMRDGITAICDEMQSHVSEQAGDNDDDDTY